MLAFGNAPPLPKVIGCLAVDQPRSTGQARLVPIFTLLGANAVSTMGNALANVAIPFSSKPTPLPPSHGPAPYTATVLQPG